ncbi:hypothetical protein BGZ72_006965 [Mortierella alpina]|nr:hypothetical protein BGZ72_006965 [Mortierella alpina]
MFNTLLKKASESSFAAMASEALEARPGSPAGSRRPPGSPLTGQQQNGAQPQVRKACHQQQPPIRFFITLITGNPHELAIPTRLSGPSNPHSSNAQLASQLDEAHSDIESFQKLLQKAAQEKAEASQQKALKSADQLRSEKDTLCEELEEARAVIKAMRSTLEDKAADEFLSPKLAGQDGSSDVGTSDPLGAVSAENGVLDMPPKGSSESTESLPANEATELSVVTSAVASSVVSALEEKIKDLTLQLSTQTEKSQELERTLNQRSEDLTKQKSDHDEKMKKMKAIFAAANKNLNEYRQTIAAKDEEIAELRSRLETQPPAVLDEQVTEQNQAVQDLEAELKSQSEAAAIKFQQMEGKYRQANSQLEKLKEEYQQYKQRASTLLQQQRESVQTDDDSKLKELQDQLEVMSKDNRSIANDLQEAEARKSQAESELQLAMDQIASLESSHEMSRRQERQHTRQLKDLERALKDAQREREAAESRIASLQELQAVEAQSLMQELGGNTKHIEERLAKKEEENAELHRILDRSSDELAAAKQEIQNLRDLVSSSEAKPDAPTFASASASPHNDTEVRNQVQQLLISTGMGARPSFPHQDQESPISRASSSMSLPTERPAVYSTLSDLLAAKPLVDRSPFSEPNAGPAVHAPLSSTKEKEYQVKLQHLTELLNESEANHQRLLDQEKLLKEEIRNQDRAERRQNLSVDYLKNIVLKYLETTDREPLLPVLTTVLQLSPAEVASLRKKNQASASSLVLGGLFGGGH